MTITKPSGRRRIVARRALLAATTILAAGIITPVAAQLTAPAPVHRSVDANGVDLFAGTMNVTSPGISMGQGNPQGLSYFFINTGGGWSDNITAALDSDGSTATVRLGGSTDDFSVSGSTFTSKEGRGATLVQNGTIYTYTASDGTVVRFDANRRAAAPYYAGLGRAVDVTRPSGAKLVYDYYGTDICTSSKPGGDGQICLHHDTAYRLSTVTSSYGYQLGFAYQSDETGEDPDNGAQGLNLGPWSSVQSVNLTNLRSANPVTLSESATRGSSSFAVTDAMNRTTSYRVDASGRVLGITRPGGTSENVTVAYDGNSHRVSSVASAAGTWSYGAPSDQGSERSVTVTAPSNAATTYVFDLSTALMKRMTDALGNQTVWAYDASNRLTSATAPEGNSVTYTYDARGNVTDTVVTAKSGGGTLATHATYDATCGNAVTCNLPHWTQDAKGNQTDYEYDPTHGGVTKVTSPAGANGVQPGTRFSYTAYTDHFGGTVYRQTGSSTCRTTAATACGGTADEIVTGMDYGSIANNLLPQSMVKRAGDNSVSTGGSMAYDSTGNVVTSTDPLGAQTHYTYDADRELTETISADPDGAGPLKPRASRTTYNQDGSAASVEVGTDTGNAFQSLQQVTTSYDAALRPTRQTMSAGGTIYSVVDTDYDVVNRYVCTAQRMNPAAFGARFNACSLGTQGADGPDRVTATHYDAVGRVDQVTRAYLTGDAATEAASYSSNGRLAAVADAKGNTTAYAYDWFDRPVRTSYPNASGGGVSSSDYDEVTLDANGNVTGRRMRDGSYTGYGVDALNRVTVAYLTGGYNGANPSFSYDNLGELTGATNGNNVFNTQTYFEWDALGHKRAESNAHNGITKVAHFQYDAAGRRIFQLWDDGFAIHYDYDALGEMTNIHNDTATFVNFGYDDLGRRTGMGRGNGTSSGYSYDAASRLTGLANALPNTGKDLVLQFGYNTAGQIVSRTSSNDAYAFTGSGNANKGYATNGLNQYSQVGGMTFSYDGRGNATSTGGQAFGYDGLNQLGQAGNTRLDYDALGRLVYDTASGLWQEHDGGNVTAEYDGSGTMQRRYLFGPGTDEPLVWFEGAGTTDRRFLHADERGSVVAVTGDAGQVLATNTYDEYGNPGANNIGRFQYTGQKWLSGLGLYDYKARMYSPSLGRFMQTDPMGYGDGLNWYNYVGGDPINFTDPLGLFCADSSSGGSEADCKDHGGYVANSPFDQRNGPDVFVNGSKCAASNGCFQTSIDSLNRNVIITVPGQAIFAAAAGDTVVIAKKPQNPQCPVPPSPGPGKATINQNIAEAQRQAADNHNNPAAIDWLANLEDESFEVVDSHSQNYKANPRYRGSAPYGNFNFGATMQARGFSLPSTLGYSNAFQRLTTGRADPPEDVRDVTNGYKYAQNNCR